MGAIAKSAGVTRQLLYVHFDGRTSLLLELARAIDAETRTPELQRQIDEAQDAVAALRAMVRVQGEIKREIQSIAAAVNRLRDSDAAAAAAWEEREQARYERLLSVIERLDREGLLVATLPVSVAARLAWSLTSQRAWEELVVDGGWSTGKWVQYTTQLLETALVDRGRQPGGNAR